MAKTNPERYWEHLFPTGSLSVNQRLGLIGTFPANVHLPANAGLISHLLLVDPCPSGWRGLIGSNP